MVGKWIRGGIYNAVYRLKQRIIISFVIYTDGQCCKNYMLMVLKGEMIILTLVTWFTQWFTIFARKNENSDVLQTSL